MTGKHEEDGSDDDEDGVLRLHNSRGTTEGEEGMLQAVVAMSVAVKVEVSA